MLIRKMIEGKIINLKLERIKKYRRYNLYQVYKLENDKWIPTYQTTYTHAQIQNMINKNYILYEEDDYNNDNDEETEELICL